LQCKYCSSTLDLNTHSGEKSIADSAFSPSLFALKTTKM